MTVELGLAGTARAKRVGVARLAALLLAAIVAAGCTLRADIGFEDKSAVQTPVYAANKVLFASPRPNDNRYARLLDGYEVATEAARSEEIRATRRSVRNRDPLSIVVSRAYVPQTINECSRRMSDSFRGKARDIAVLLDVSTATDREEFIAVWYQRDVPPGEALNFQDLLVYSSDSWDAKYPPYFRLRLVDVSSERNTETGALLDRIRANSSTITSLVGVPDASPLIGLASLAASQVLTHERNNALVDFTFQLYNAALLGEAGGIPLGILQTGGLVVTSAPCGQNNGYWENSYQFDHRLQRIEDATSRNIQEIPFVFATILTADLSVPQIVRARSAAIMKRLTDPKIVQNDLVAAQNDADRLVKALDSLNVRESFRRRPSKEAFGTMVQQISDNWGNLDDAEKGFFLDALYQVTGANRHDIAEYVAWSDACGKDADFDMETARFKRDDAKGAANQCWP